MASAAINIENYKGELILDIINSEGVVGAIDSQQDGVFESDDLIYKNVFPFHFVPGTERKADCYVLIAVNILRINPANAAFVDLNLKLWALCHAERMRMPDGGTRIDRLAEEFRGLFDGVSKYGFGTLQLVDSTEFVYNEKFICREVNLRTVDLKMSSYNKVGSFR